MILFMQIYVKHLRVFYFNRFEHFTNSYHYLFGISKNVIQYLISIYQNFYPIIPNENGSQI